MSARAIFLLFHVFFLCPGRCDCPASTKWWGPNQLRLALEVLGRCKRRTRVEDFTAWLRAWMNWIAPGWKLGSTTVILLPNVNQQSLRKRSDTTEDAVCQKWHVALSFSEKHLQETFGQWNGAMLGHEVDWGRHFQLKQQVGGCGKVTRGAPCISPPPLLSGPPLIQRIQSAHQSSLSQRMSPGKKLQNVLASAASQRIRNSTRYPGWAGDREKKLTQGCNFLWNFMLSVICRSSLNWTKNPK